jgi:hypothetical protein
MPPYYLSSTSSYSTRCTTLLEVRLAIWKCPEIALTNIAYTIYSFFEWALVLLDVGFDAVTMIEFQNIEVQVRDLKGISRGYVRPLPE